MGADCFQRGSGGHLMSSLSSGNPLATVSYFAGAVTGNPPLAFAEVIKDRQPTGAHDRAN